MTSKLSGIKLTPRRRSSETDPLKIFDNLTLRGSVKNIWGPQIEALREWHISRHAPRTILEMNTGGGKTLIALLIAQSLVNETGGRVLIVCPTNQLIEQTRQQARECGLENSAYYSGVWQDEHVFREARGPCITNYAALCNGKSVFRKETISALILDDAHVAAPIIRGCFTLSLASKTKMFEEVVNLFKPFLEVAGHSQELAALLDGDLVPLLFIPAFQLDRQHQLLTKLLVDCGVAEDKSTLFAWEHLRDHIDRCAVFISSSRIEISPLLIPLDTMPQMASAQRAIYMTATLPSSAQFARTFGPGSQSAIRPGGKSGEAQRLIVLAAGESDDEQREWAKQLVKDEKACIITSSSRGAERWTDCASLYDGSTGQAGLDLFKQAASPEKLVIAARYDGIDLPGDSCRVLIIDGLPMGTHLIDRFADEMLHIKELRASATALRVTQAIGRIFRSNTDHGIVVICGKDVQNWIRNPQNQRFLPSLLQKQIQLGIQLAEVVRRKESSFDDLMAGLLQGDDEWDRLYRDAIDGYDTLERPAPPAWLISAAEKENSACQRFWAGDYLQAAQQFSQLSDEAEKHDRNLGAWFRHWLGLSQNRLGQKEVAQNSYLLAANVSAQLGRPSLSGKQMAGAPSASLVGQAQAIGVLAKKMVQVRKSLKRIRCDLAYGDKTNQAESAIAELGNLLGLIVSRPDKDSKTKTGPDVLWRHKQSKTGVALEAKTDKKLSSQYNKKDDIGQFHDHVQYLKNAHSGEKFRKVIVGRILPVSSASNPPEDLWIIGLEAFLELLMRVEQLYTLIEAATDNDPLAERAARFLQPLGLCWPECIDALPRRLAVDLQKSVDCADPIS